MNIIRTTHENNFTITDNTFATDRRLKPNAIFLFFQVLILHKDWNFTVSGMSIYLKVGKDFITTALKQLEEFGYCYIDRTRKNGRFDYQYYFYENPKTNPHYLCPTQKPAGDEKPAAKQKQATPVEKTVAINDNKSNKSNTRPTYDEIIDGKISNKQVNSVMKQYLMVKVLHAKKMHSVFTNDALIHTIDKLFKMSNMADEQIKILNYAIDNTCDLKQIYTKKQNNNNTPAPQPVKNRFNNFPQREYSQEEFHDIEMRLLGCGKYAGQGRPSHAAV